MNKEQIMENLKKKRQIVIDLGYKPVYLALRGSQNYKLEVYNENYQSDIDVVCYVQPSKMSLVRGDKMVSVTHVCEDWSHIDIKDIRLLIDLIYKTNVSFLETLATEYYILEDYAKDEINFLRKNVNKPALLNTQRLAKGVKGMYMQKKTALYKDYPSQKEVVDKYGYAPKQLHHMARLCFFLLDFSISPYFQMALVPTEPVGNELLKLKTEFLTIDQVKKYEEELDVFLDSVYKLYENKTDKTEEFETYMEQVRRHIYNIVLKEL